MKVLTNDNEVLELECTQYQTGLQIYAYDGEGKVCWDVCIDVPMHVFMRKLVDGSIPELRVISSKIELVRDDEEIRVV